MRNTMTHQFQNKRALVTGGSRGIAAAIVKRLAREGADIALTYVSKPDQADETAKAARALGVQAIAIQADNADARRRLAPWSERYESWGALTFW
jgi:3-oxoacyl-[acyl-carrier protein] reductase